jgi:hypothetical protein
MADPLTVYYRRKDAAEYLRNKYRQSVNNNLLSKLACKGGGPKFRKIGGDAIYEEGDLDAFAIGRLGPKFSSTSELTVGRTKSKGRPPVKKGERRIPPEAKRPAKAERVVAP